MISVVCEDGKNENSSDHTVNGAALPLVSTEKRCEALKEFYVVEESREDPDAGSKN